MYGLLDDSDNNHAYRPTADDVATEDLLPPTEVLHPYELHHVMTVLQVQQHKLCGYLNKQTGRPPQGDY